MLTKTPSPQDTARGGTGQTTFTDGQLLIGNSTGNTLTKATLTGTTNQINIANGNGSITLSLPQSIATTSTPQFASIGLGKTANAGIGAEVFVDGTTRMQGVRIEGNAASAIGYSSFVTGDAQIRFTFLADGTARWGNGSVVADTNLYRVSTGVLKSDGSLVLGTAGTSTGSVTTIDGTQSLTNKNITSSTNTFPSFLKNRNQIRLEAQGMLSETYPYGSIVNTSIMVSQTVYYALIGLIAGDTVTNIHVEITSPGTASTSTFVALYDSSGNRVAVSGDLTTALDSSGLKTLALTSPYSVTTTGAYYAAVLTISSVPATIARGSSASSGFAAIGAGVKSFATQTGQSTMPTTATFGTGTIATWVGIS